MIKKITLSMMLMALVLVSCEKPESTQEAQPTKEAPAQKTESMDLGQRNFSAKDLYSCKRIGDVQLSPDGQWIVYVLSTPSIEDNKLYKDLYLLKSDGSETKQITDDKFADYNPRWSNDGKELAFISTRKDDTPQIFIYNIGSGVYTQVTNSDMDACADGIGNMGWSPDNSKFFFTADVKVSEGLSDMYPELKKAEVRIYDKVPARHWDHWVDNKASHLFVIDRNGGKPKDMMEGEIWETPLSPFGGVEEIAWSPDGKEITYTSKKLAGSEFVETTNSDLYSVNLETGKTVNITKGMEGFDKAPNYSPDGKWIAFHSQERGGFESDKIRLMLFNRETKEISELTKNLDQWVMGETWSSDSKNVYLNATDSGTVKLFKFDLEGNWEYVAKDLYNYHAPSITPDSKTIIVAKESMKEPTDIYAINSETLEQTQLTAVNEELMANVNDVTVTQRWVKAKDGKMIHTWVLLPPNFDETKKYPMITYCQGGPQSMIGQRFHYRWNYFMMASEGYVVMLPNRRGLPGFGQDWNDAISQDWAGMPMQDILSCTDAVAAEPWVNNDALSAVGASAGGYAVFWLAGNHEGRFKSFIAHCGVFNLTSMYGSTEELWFTNWENGGPYWDKKNSDYYVKHSPHTYVNNWDTPILIITGENDFRVPYTQSLEAYQVAQAKGIESQLMVFPKESHFVAHPQEFIVWNTQFFKWLDKYCKK
jgi:dipeptidyl aminopeptidase/acylaminoacyl peptidase